jgi:hypothetical protein
MGRRGTHVLAQGGSPVWPMAVGVVLVPLDFTGQTRAEQRLSLALGAYRMGFFLVDLLDVPAWAADPTRSWAPVWDLAARTDAEAVIVHGGLEPDLPDPPKGLRGLPLHLLSPEGR